MGIVRKTSPYLRRPESSVQRMMYDVIIALLPVSIFAIYKFGWAAVMILSLSVISMCLTEYLFYFFSDKVNNKKLGLVNESFSLYNGTAVISGLIYGLILPDSTPWYVVVIGAVFGIFLGKLVFGGMGANIFNVAGFARVFVMISFGALTTYNVDTVAGATALGDYAANGFTENLLNNFKIVDLFTGIGIPGSLGEVSALLIILGGIYLSYRRSLDYRIPVMYVGTFLLLLISVVIYNFYSNGAVFQISGLAKSEFEVSIQYILFHLLSGGLIFGAVFMATDPVTAPVTGTGRIYYAFGLGLITFLIRMFGSYPEGVVFSILIMNMFVPAFDYYKLSNPKFTKKSLSIFSIIVILSIIVVIVGVA